jgi:hypothetical protein
MGLIEENRISRVLLHPAICPKQKFRRFLVLGAAGCTRLGGEAAE